MLKKILVVLVVLVMIVLFLLIRDWDSPELGQALLDKAGEATGFEMSAEGFRLNLLHGLVLEGVVAKSSTPGRTVDLALDRLVFEHRLAPLLSRTVAVDRVVLERPRFELVETGGPGSTGTPKAEAEKGTTQEGERTGEGGAVTSEGGLSLAIEEIAIRDATVAIRTEKPGEEPKTTRIEGLDVLFQNIRYVPNRQPPIQGFAAQGELGIRQVSFDTIQVRDAEAELSVSEGRFDMNPLRFVMDEGRFTANLQVDFNKTPFAYRLSSQGDPLDFNAMVRAEEGFGPGSLQIDAQGVGTDSKDIRGKGSLALAAGQFPAISVLSQIDEKLGKPVVVGTSYKATELRFRLADNVVTLDPFPFETDQAKMMLDGWINLGGPLGLEFAVGVPREGIRIEGVGENVLDVLADKEGWVMIPITVSGDQNDPKVRPDTKALLAQAAEGTKRLATETATDALRGLLKKKKNP